MPDLIGWDYKFLRMKKKKDNGNTIIIVLGLLATAAYFVFSKKKSGFAVEPLPTKPIDGMVVTSIPQTTTTGSTGNSGSVPRTGNTGSGNTGSVPSSNSGSGSGSLFSFDSLTEVKKLAGLLKDETDLTHNDNAAFRRILNYTDAQLKAVDSKWKEFYKKDRPYGVKATLRQQVEAEFIISWMRLDDAAANKKKVLERFNRLGIV